MPRKVFKIKTETMSQTLARVNRAKKQNRKIARIAKREIMKTTEAKHSHWRGENVQLVHNQVAYVENLMATSQGFDDNQAEGHSGFPAGTDIRDGDMIYLNNINAKIWFSNKHDRPNVMYRFILFTYDSEEIVNSSLVFFTSGNKMLDRPNNKKINVLASKYVKSGPDYTLNAHERSNITTMNVKYKNPKRIQYADNASTPKLKNLGLAVVAYDAFGTLQSDEIASFAYDIKLTWRDP